MSEKTEEKSVPGQPEGQPQVGYAPQPAYPPGPGYPPQAGYPPQGSYPPQAGYPPQGGYPPQAGYPPQEVAGFHQQPVPPGQKQPVVWMQPPPQVAPGCPPGLEYLTQVDQLLVAQQIEIFEMFTGFETQNKYRILNSLGQQVYFAAEDSNCCARQYCGPARPFHMAILDNNQREVIHLDRPYRCSCWCCFCCLQKVEVQSPPGTVIGYVEQDISFVYPWYSLKDANGDTILKVKGPICGCRCCWDVDFQVLSANGETEVGKITKKWSGLAQEYFTKADNFGVQFPMDLDVKMKAVVLAATFLIDFMFFEENQNNRRR